MQRILVVDDEHLVADTLSTIFRKEGFEVRTAYGADEAMAAARVFEPEVLLCDITMPGRTGLELMADMTRELPSCRVVVLTGYYSNVKPVDEQSRGWGRMTPVLVKPCPPDELIRQVGLLLEN